MQHINALYHDFSMPVNTLVPNIEYTHSVMLMMLNIRVR